MHLKLSEKFKKRRVKVVMRHKLKFTNTNLQAECRVWRKEILRKQSASVI